MGQYAKMWDWPCVEFRGPAGLPTRHIVGDVQPTSFRRCFERLGRYQHSYPMDADALARIRGNVRRAFAASVNVALLERIHLRRLLCFEFTRHYLADHVIRHRIRRGGCSGLPYDIDYLNALVGGEVGVPGSDFHHTDPGAKLLAVHLDHIPERPRASSERIGRLSYRVRLRSSDLPLPWLPPLRGSGQKRTRSTARLGHLTVKLNPLGCYFPAAQPAVSMKHTTIPRWARRAAG